MAIHSLTPPRSILWLGSFLLSYNRLVLIAASAEDSGLQFCSLSLFLGWNSQRALWHAVK